MESERKNYSSDEAVEGQSKMVQVGPFVYCGGTTSVNAAGEVAYAGDSYGQVRSILEKLIAMISKTGAVKEDVYQVKLYVTSEFEGKEGLRAFREIFGEIKPIMTCVTVHNMFKEGHLVEIEMNAIKGSSRGETWRGIKLERTNYSAMAPNELKYGYSRMVKIGPFVYIGGTTSVQPDGSVAGVGDACEQNKKVYDKLLGIMEKAGASIRDIVKIKKYVTEEYFETWEERYAYKIIPREEIVLSRVVVDSLLRKEQIVETEIFAIVGCGEDKLLPEWGEFDFRKKVKIADEEVWASFVQAGPFLISGTRHSIDSLGALVGADDSELQESQVLKNLTEGMKYFGYEPKHMVKLKAYFTDEFEEDYGDTEIPYYEKVYKPVSPLYTGVHVKRVGRKHEIVEMEMLAMK